MATHLDYPDVQLFIDGVWREGSGGESQAVVNPATGLSIGRVAHAAIEDLDLALAAAQRGLGVWRRLPAFDRYKIMRKAAEILRGRIEPIARKMTLEQGKALWHARMEVTNAAEIIDWFAEEARRVNGLILPPRVAGGSQFIIQEPVGVVAAFTPWNFPINQANRKISAALAAGCAIIVKGPEETPASCAALVRCFAEAGVPEGVINLVFGVPAQISEYLIPHPTVRKISFTGSTGVGKKLASLAGLHMKRVTMELGGHAPVMLFADADIDQAVRYLSDVKFRNAGQVCTSPTRFLVHEAVHDEFLEKFLQAVGRIRVGDGLEPETVMGPMANVRRVEAMERLVADAVARGARVDAGGKRIGNAGFFFEPTVMTRVPTSAQLMNEEPFGPIVPILPFRELDEVVAEANRLPYGLAAYAYTRSAHIARAVHERVEAGMVSINHHGLAVPEAPFGGIRESGYGTEGGAAALDAYLVAKFVTQVNL